MSGRIHPVHLHIAPNRERNIMSDEKRRRDLRAKLKWRVLAKEKGAVIDGVTKDISISGAYVCCAKPLRLNEVFNMVIEAPNKRLKAKAEVVWSNIYGPDDEINPRGMGVRFLEISSEDRKEIAKEILQHLKPDEEVDGNQLKALKTLIIDQKQIGPPQV
jgi:c-di-GMP-binding flagellar brake protein YcgR